MLRCFAMPEIESITSFLSSRKASSLPACPSFCAPCGEPHVATPTARVPATARAIARAEATTTLVALFTSASRARRCCSHRWRSAVQRSLHRYQSSCCPVVVFRSVTLSASSACRISRSASSTPCCASASGSGCGRGAQVPGRATSSQLQCCLCLESKLTHECRSLRLECCERFPGVGEAAQPVGVLAKKRVDRDPAGARFADPCVAAFDVRADVDEVLPSRMAASHSRTWPAFRRCARSTTSDIVRLTLWSTSMGGS